MKMGIVIAGILASLVAGFVVPIDSYTTTKGCPTNPVPKQRLHLIFGDSINDIKNSDVEPPPNVGCSVNTKFVLYLL